VSLPNTDSQTTPTFLDEAALQELTDLLDETHPQVALAAFQSVDDSDAAVFLVMCTHLKSESMGNALATHAGKLFAQLPFDKQISIAEKVTTTETVDSEHAMQIWNEQITRIKEAIQKTTFLGEGTANLAKLLSHMDVTEQNELLEALGEKQPGVVNSVSEQLLAFEDLGNLGDEAIKTILQVLDKPTLALALHNAPAAIRDRFFENMPASQAEAVETETTQLTFEQTQIADTARHSVVSLVRNFAAKGLLKIG
jgi:flagellar motor switch protein FliG